ncbi:MAG: N-acetylglucosamine-6-phosphate deacetylase [Acidimicrobiales bacterium]
MPIISAPRLLVDDALAGPGAVRIEGDRIVEVLAGAPPPGPDHLALSGGILSPGLVDLQVNGAFGVDLVRASAEEWRAVSERLPATGVTAFQPTYITAPLATLLDGLRRTPSPAELEQGGGARILGVHLEGPFLSPMRAGVHDPAHMRLPAPDLVEDLVGAAAGGLTMVTLAPELPGALAAIRRLAAAGVRVSVGHSDATAAQVRAAADAGATMVTHVFNAQRGLGHREPGVAGQGLADPRLVVGLIADLRHVAPQVCAIVMQAAPGRVALVTDAIAAAGMPPGRYELGGIQVEVGPGDALPRRLDGTIAGSSLSLDRAVRNVAGLGTGLAGALVAASRVPADALGRKDLGRLAPGARADLVWWSDELSPLCTWVGGRVAQGAEAVAGVPA